MAHRMTFASGRYCSKKRSVPGVWPMSPMFFVVPAALKEDGFLRGGGLREGGQGGRAEGESRCLEKGAAGGHG
jgi:hypothetical protein